jgi:hypothetical protein
MDVAVRLRAVEDKREDGAHGDENGKDGEPFERASRHRQILATFLTFAAGLYGRLAQKSDMPAARVQSGEAPQKLPRDTWTRSWFA